jgi:hypothetical protein
MPNELDFNLQGFWSLNLSGRLFQKLPIFIYKKVTTVYIDTSGVADMCCRHIFHSLLQ